MIYLGSSSGTKIQFFEKFSGSTGDLLGWFLCNRLSFGRGSWIFLGTFFLADFLWPETAKSGRNCLKPSENQPKPTGTVQGIPANSRLTAHGGRLVFRRIRWLQAISAQSNILHLFDCPANELPKCSKKDLVNIWRFAPHFCQPFGCILAINQVQNSN